MIVDNLIKIGFDELSKRECEKLEQALTFTTPAGEAIICYQKMTVRGRYVLPRGAWNLLPDHVRYYDRRVCPSMPKLKFAVKLNATEKDKRFAGQQEAVEAMFENEQGLIIRPPGTGKTQIACKFSAKCKTRTLILVHTKDIFQQWVGAIENSIPELKGKVGEIRGKVCNEGHVTVAMVQTISGMLESKDKEWWAQWGCVIADEAHHVSAPTWEAILHHLPAKYRFGFTASATRADSMHPTMKFIIGPVIAHQKFSSPVKLEVIPVRTGFKFQYRGNYDWSRMLNALTTDDRRNAKIAKVINAEAEAGNTCLVLSRRIEQLENVRGLVTFPSEILVGSRKVADRRRILDDFRSGSLGVLFATQLADEALDVQRLNRVFLIHPGKAEGRIIQQVGRAIRMHPDKTDAVIYDFIDTKIRVLRKQWSSRKRAYRQNRISVRTIGRLKWR